MFCLNESFIELLKYQEMKVFLQDLLDTFFVQRTISAVSTQHYLFYCLPYYVDLQYILSTTKTTIFNTIVNKSHYHNQTFYLHASSNAPEILTNKSLNLKFNLLMNFDCSKKSFLFPIDKIFVPFL